MKTFTRCQSSSGFLLIFFCFFDVNSMRVACFDFVPPEKEAKPEMGFSKSSIVELSINKFYCLSIVANKLVDVLWGTDRGDHLKDFQIS